MIPDSVVIAGTRAWLVRAVIGLNLCPFARAVHTRNQVRYVVSRATRCQRAADGLRRRLSH